MGFLGLLTLALLLTAPAAATSDGEVTTHSNDTSLPLTYRARVITTIGPVCPSDRTNKQLRDEITQDIRDQIRDSIVPTSCSAAPNPAASCSALPTSCPSGYYWIRSSNGSAVQLYCDMDRVCGCRGTGGGWTRVAFLNMTDPSQQCPGAWTLRTRNSKPKRLCGRGRSGASCLSVIYNTYGMNYSRVCGRVIGYEDTSPSAFSQNSNRQRSIDSIYLDGVSVTHGPPGARQHIWSFAAGFTETLNVNLFSCPCANRATRGYVPSYVGNDYFCESGNAGSGHVNTLYATDPLWDGEGCGASTCCELSYPPGVTPPWFCKQLPQATTDEIEVRLCADEGTTNEDIPLELVELYIHN